MIYLDIDEKCGLIVDVPEWPAQTVPTAGPIGYGRFGYILTADL